MSFRGGIRREEPEINFIPLIDLLLVILIFLMVTTTYSKFTELQVNLPSASADQATEQPAEIVVGVAADGRYLLDAGNPKFVAPDTLAAELQVNLPSASADQATERPAEIVVGVAADGRYLLDAGNPKFVAPDTLAAELAQAAADRKEPSLVIHADAGATHQSVIAVLEAARQAGIARVTFAAQSGSQGGSVR